MEKRTIVDQIEVTREGHLQIRMRKQIVDGDTAHEMGYHRTSVEPGGDCEKQLEMVNEHLEVMGHATVADAEWRRVRAIADAVSTELDAKQEAKSP